MSGCADSRRRVSFECISYIKITCSANVLLSIANLKTGISSENDHCMILPFWTSQAFPLVAGLWAIKLPEHHQILAITFGGSDFPEITGFSRSSVLGLTLVHKIVVFGRNLNRGSFERHLSAPHIGIPCKNARKSASTWEFHVIPRNYCLLHRIPM